MVKKILKGVALFFGLLVFNLLFLLIVLGILILISLIDYFIIKIILFFVVGISLGGLIIKDIKLGWAKALTEEEFKSLKKERKNYLKKTRKKENKAPRVSLKKLKQLNRKGIELNKKYFAGTVFFHNYLFFILFSLYYETCVLLKPFLTIKNIKKIKEDSLLDIKKGKKVRFGWRRIKDKKKQDFYYIIEKSWKESK